MHLPNYVDPENANYTHDFTNSYEMFNMSGTQSKPYSVTVEFHDCNLEMEIDTGVSLSIINVQTYYFLWPIQSCPKLQPTTVKLHTYTKEPIKVLGLITVYVCCKLGVKKINAITSGGWMGLLGRDWLGQLKLDWQKLYQINQPKTVYKQFQISTMQCSRMSLGKLWESLQSCT